MYPKESVVLISSVTIKGVLLRKGSQEILFKAAKMKGEVSKMDTDEERLNCEAMVADSNQVVEFKLIRSLSDMENEGLAFRPTMSHQIFGSQETIFGYKNLKVKLYFSAACLNPYLEVSYSEKVEAKKRDSVEADNIHDILTQKLGISFNENFDEFIHSLDREGSFIPPGELKESLVFDNENQGNGGDPDKKKTYEVYYAEVTSPGLIAYHKKLQTFILWFIDAASFIDADDDRWKFFLMFEKYKKDGDTMYAIVGYATVYEYYAYPMNIRPRLSQMLVLPPFQHQGLGAAILTSIYNHYRAISNIRDITVEDPSEELQLVRDFVDCKSCMELESFQPKELWSNGFTAEMAQEAASKLKINKKQARRVYEILKLKALDKSNAKQYQQYRIEVKRRLNIPNQNEQIKMRKLEAFLKPQEMAEMKTAFTLSSEQRISNLDKSYRELEALYERVLNRLSLQ